MVDCSHNSSKMQDDYNFSAPFVKVGIGLTILSKMIIIFLHLRKSGDWFHNSFKDNDSFLHLCKCGDWSHNYFQDDNNCSAPSQKWGLVSQFLPILCTVSADTLDDG